MAIYHLQAQIIGRSSGRNSTAAAAYRAGERIEDPRTGMVFDYRRRRHVAHKEILLPVGAPAWAGNRASLWQAVESVETRKDAQLCRELQIALPHELSRREQTRLVKEYLQRCFVAKGMVCDLCIHQNPNNVHAHVLVTTRELHLDGFKGKCRRWNQKQMLEWWRESWSRSVNTALARKGLAERIDHRTLEAQLHAVENKIYKEEVTMTTTTYAPGEIGAPNRLQSYKTVGMTHSRPTATLAAEQSEILPHDLFEADAFLEYLREMCLRLFPEATVGVKRDNEEAPQEYRVVIGDSIKIAVRPDSVAGLTGTAEEVAAMARMCKELGWTSVKICVDDGPRKEGLYIALLAVGYHPEDIIGYAPEHAPKALSNSSNSRLPRPRR